MNKKVTALRVLDRDAVKESPELSEDTLRLMGDVVGTAREGLLALSVSVGLMVFAQMMEEEVTERVGAKHEKNPQRSASRHGSAAGSVVLGSRRVKVDRPRVRTADGAEATLQTYGAFRDDD